MKFLKDGRNLMVLGFVLIGVIGLIVAFAQDRIEKSADDER